MPYFKYNSKNTVSICGKKNKFLLNYQYECGKQTLKEKTFAPYHSCGFSSKWHNRSVLCVVCIWLPVM